MKTTTFALLLAMGSPLVFAQSLVPTKLSYQGRVSDSSGTLIGATSAVNRTVYFKLYTTSTGGTPVWAESQTVTISAGEFSVLIGNGTGISTFVGPSAPATTFKTLAEIINTASNTPLYLGVTVDDGNSNTTDVEISPRQQLVSGAFALRAVVAESVASSGITASMIASGVVGTDALGTSAVTTAKVATSAITADKIGDSAVTTAKLGASSVTAAKIDTLTVGTWSTYTTNGSVYRASGNVGIGNSAPSVPLHFAPSLGDKISLWGDGTGQYGFGIQGSLLQIYTGAAFADVAFGYGNSNNFTEAVRIKGSGMVGIGTSVPAFPLSFANAYGDKIYLYSSTAAPTTTTNHFGLGVQSGALQIHTDVQGSDIVFGYGRSASTGFTERVRIKGTGSVGIGTNAPAGPLHIYESTGSTVNPTYGSLTLEHGNAGGASSIVFRSKNNAGSDFGYIQYQDDSSTNGGGESARLVIGTSNDGDDHLILNPSGYVGVRQGSPSAPLHVGAAGVSYTYYGRLTTSGASATGGSGTSLLSLRCDGGVLSEFVHVFSDRRIKKDLARSDMGADLKTLLGIEVTDYKFVDSVQGGNRSQKKVIAQQLAEVYPLAVSKGDGFIPDIFQEGSFKDGWVHLEKEPTSPLKVGDRVRVIEDKADNVYKVVEVGVGKFRTTSAREDGKVFVYGREVNDFHSVDYDAISMLNVSATQELHKQLEAERSETAALRRKLSELESSLGARLEALEKASKTTK